MTSQLQSNAVRVATREPNGFAPGGWTRASDGVVVVVVMVVPLVVPLSAARDVVVMMVRMRDARILAEHERLDRHGDSERGHTHATQVDVVEVPERDAVERQHVGCDGTLLFQQRTDGLCDVAVENQENRPSRRDRSRQRVNDATRESHQSGVCRSAAPAKRERDFRVALDEVERSK